LRFISHATRAGVAVVAKNGKRVENAMGNGTSHSHVHAFLTDVPTKKAKQIPLLGQMKPVSPENQKLFQKPACQQASSNAH